MKAKKIIKSIKKIAKFNQKILKLRKELNKTYFFEGISDWECISIHRNCSIKDNALYDNNGVILSTQQYCVNNEIFYFGNKQYYFDEGSYGTMYVKVNKNTFIEIAYESW